MTQSEFNKLLWQSLKDVGCYNPKTAKRIVMLNEEDVKKASKVVFEKLNSQYKDNE